MSGIPPVNLKALAALGDALSANRPIPAPSLPVSFTPPGSDGSTHIDEVIAVIDHANYRVAFFAAAIGLVQGVPDALKRLMQG